MQLAVASLEFISPPSLEKPFDHFLVLTGITGRPADARDTEPVTATKIQKRLEKDTYPDAFALSERAICEVLADLETMGLVETWIDVRGRDGRVKQIHG